MPPVKENKMTDLVIVQRPLIKDPTQFEKLGTARDIRQCPEPDEDAPRRRAARIPVVRPRTLARSS